MYVRHSCKYCIHVKTFPYCCMLKTLVCEEQNKLILKMNPCQLVMLNRDIWDRHFRCMNFFLSPLTSRVFSFSVQVFFFFFLRITARKSFFLDKFPLQELSPHLRSFLIWSVPKPTCTNNRETGSLLH